ncbi:MAG: SGNH/GDSL hydrolase family protein [Lentisphaerae bacterium]|nr:SGNH/GDSL hydrolase family protein [Lentisphaerota bacterium]
MKIYVIGDSISMHYGPYLQNNLRGAMEYSRKGGDGEEGNGGDSSTVLSFLREEVQKGGIDADLLLVNCGLHDIKTDPATGARQVPIETYEENLRAIVETAAGIKPDLLWIRTTPCDEAVHNKPGAGFHRFAADCAAYNMVADGVMLEAGVPVIDLYTFTSNLGDDLYCDHVHLHEHIREKQGAFIAGWLTAFVQERERTREGEGTA